MPMTKKTIVSTRGRRAAVLGLVCAISVLSVAYAALADETWGTGILDGFETGSKPFVTTWRVAGPDKSITIPVGNATGTYTVDWGDGSVSANVTGDQKHTYYYGETHTVRITGNFEQIYLNGHTTNAPKLQSIEQWGDISWTSMGSAFYGASNMAYNAADSPDLSDVTDMSGMFHDASSFNGDISEWDVSHVTDMSDMFHGAFSFNRDLSKWDVSNVTDMSGMFTGGLVGDVPGGVDVSSEPTLPFYYVSSFNFGLVMLEAFATPPTLPFYYVSSFNGNISEWDVSKVTDMSDMFRDANHFKGNLSSWDVSSVTDMSGMFDGADKFNGNLSSWDVSSVTDMTSMFSGTKSFRGDISGWDISGVTDMSYMFLTSHFNGDISGWDVSSVEDMGGMFRYASFNGDISGWDVSSVSDMHDMFSFSDFNSDISGWDVSSVEDMREMFFAASSFKSDISGWDISGVTDMSEMFMEATSFNGDLSSWDVSGVTDMSQMFSRADSFNGDLSSWDVSGVTDMTSMFWENQAFNGDLSSWDVSGVTDMSGMFSHANSFNQNLGSWYVVLDSTSIDIGGGATKIGNIAAQNPFLDSQNPTYRMESGTDSDLFVIDGDVLVTKPSVDYSGKTEYAVNITSTGDFGKNNFKVINVTVTEAGNTGLP